MNFLRRRKPAVVGDDIPTSVEHAGRMLFGDDWWRSHQDVERRIAENNRRDREQKEEIESLLKEGRARLGQQLVQATSAAKNQSEVKQAQAEFDRQWANVVETTKRLYEPLTVSRIASKYEKF